MPFRIMIMPLEAAGGPSGTGIVPAYFYTDATNFPTPPPLQGMLEYGTQLTGLVGAELTPAQITFLDGQADVLMFAENLLDNVGGQQRSAITAFLEPLNIPANWVSANDSSRTVIRRTGGSFQANQVYARFRGQQGVPIGERSLFASNSLNTQWQNLTQPERDALLLTAADPAINWDPSNIVATTQLRAIFQDMGEQFGGTELIMAGVVI